ncbi:MAG: ATP phosphoribosyltransferase [Chloroflexota bacterium]|nr:ATP phosphoribosyltransferase [Chloroflexota bacterium]
MQVKLALPKGQLQESTAELLKQAGFAIDDYSEGSRSYRPWCETCPSLFTKVFHEKDIAIQVAIGNYDLGICRLDWIEELLVKYHSDAVVKIRDLGYGMRAIYAVVASSHADNLLEKAKDGERSLRIVSEYPNLAEAFALKQRLRRFQIFPVWGAASSYSPENAELAIVAETAPRRLREQGLEPIVTILESGACLIANRKSMESKELGQILEALSNQEITDTDSEEAAHHGGETSAGSYAIDESLVTIALPDGHQQRHTIDFLDRAGITIEGYDLGNPNPRPRMSLDGVAVKVIRPQDMPFQVANGNFDLAITGRDWLRDHRFRFPASPVEEVLELGFGKVRIVAVVTQDMPVSTTDDLRKLPRDSVLRIASEYINITDKYAHDNHLTPCRIIPTWGASEAFLPEDADVLIENTETGSTIARNKLKIIDTLFESSACLIGNKNAMKRQDKREKISHIVDVMRRGIVS